MDDHQFDRLTRALFSRRTAISRFVASGTMAMLGLGAATAGVAACPRGKKRCKGRCIAKGACCTNAHCRPKNSGKICKRGRCVCPSSQKLCRGRCQPKAAPCPRVPAAACTHEGGGPFALIVSPTNRVGQTFIEPNGGRLTAVELWGRNTMSGNPGTFQLDVHTVDSTGLPVDNPLATAMVSASRFSTEEAWVRFSFPAPASLVPRQQYALVILLNNARPEDRGYFDTSNDQCPNGHYFFSNTRTSPFEHGIPTPDLGYKTFVKA